MIEMLLVGAIVLVAMFYSTWALMPAPARQRLARRLLALAESGRCPDWIGRRIRAAASGPGISGSPCDGCAPGRTKDDPSR
jgi:hypothetical protein